MGGKQNDGLLVTKLNNMRPCRHLVMVVVVLGGGLVHLVIWSCGNNFISMVKTGGLLNESVFESI